MKLELQDEKGLTGVFIELPMAELKEALTELGSESVSAAETPDAAAQLKESQEKVADLEERLATAEGKTLDDYAPREKSAFVIAWARGLTSEDKAIFAEAVGITKAKEAPKAEVKEPEEEPTIIEGKTDKPGYKYLPVLNLSYKE